LTAGLFTLALIRARRASDGREAATADFDS
jgi:hypothetical protein